MLLPWSRGYAKKRYVLTVVNTPAVTGTVIRVVFNNNTIIQTEETCTLYNAEA